MKRPAGLLQPNGHGNDVQELEFEVGVVLERVRVEGSADGHRLVRMDALGGGFAEKAGEPLLHHRHPRLAPTNITSSTALVETPESTSTRATI